MRNAAATFDDDYDYDAPARRTAPRKPRAASSKSPSAKAKSRKKKGKRLAIDMHRVARISAVGMSATLAIGIMVNALMMQTGHHPAPLFGKGTLAVSTAVVAPAPAKVARVTVPDPTPQAEETAAAVATAPMPVVKPRHVTATTADSSATKAPGDDQIARLLKTGVAPAAASDKSESRTVLGAQKALGRLGFALKPNGTMGPATKKAIEAFEKERNMPVDGELSHRVVKILSAESGVKID